MKNQFYLILCMLVIPVLGQSQATTLGNTPTFPPEFLGWNDNLNTNLDILQNNTIRMRFNSTNWPGYNGAPGVPNSSRIHLGLDGNTFANPFSMLHMGENINPTLSRPWMQVGTTYGAGADIMYTGILQSPGNSNNGDVVDAVIAWGCNDQLWFPANGPDNLRFLFLAPANQPVSPGSATEGLEVMRITPWGNAGIGDSFNNNQQPHRRLVVHGLDTDPQFRISTILDPDPDLGDHADFQVSPQANLHIKPRHNELDRTVCIGFLDNELDDPTSNTRLDVGGITRIRTLQEIEPQSLIIGYSFADVNETDPADHFLGRLDLPNDNNLFLDGTGKTGLIQVVG